MDYGPETVGEAVAYEKMLIVSSLSVSILCKTFR